MDGSTNRTVLPTTRSQYCAVPFLTRGVYVPAESPVNTLLACHVVPFKLYCNVPLLVDAAMVISPLVPPHVVGLVVVTEEIVVTLVVADTVVVHKPLHPTVVPVTAYAPVPVTTIDVPVDPLLHR